MSEWKEELVTEISIPYNEISLEMRRNLGLKEESNILDYSNVKEHDVDINNLLPSIKNRMKNAEK